MNLESFARIIGDSEQEWDGPELGAILDDLIESAKLKLKESFKDLEQSTRVADSGI